MILFKMTLDMIKYIIDDYKSEPIDYLGAILLVLLISIIFMPLAILIDIVLLPLEIMHCDKRLQRSCAGCRE